MTELTEENLGKIKGLILFAAVVVVSLWQYPVTLRLLSFAWSVLLPFVLGGSIAFVLHVPMDFLERKCFGRIRIGKRPLPGKSARIVSLLVVLAVFFSLIAALAFQVVPYLGETILTLGDQATKLTRTLREGLQRWSAADASQTHAWAEMAEQLMKQAEQLWEESSGRTAKLALDTTVSAAKQMAEKLATFLIAAVFGIYILLEKETLKRQWKKVLYAFVRKGRADAALEVLALTYETFSAFLTGQCVEAAILGGMFLVTLFVFGFPHAVLIGVMIAVTALIPIFGAFAGCVAGAFLVFLSAPEKTLWFLVIFLILQQIEGNFIYPHVVGHSVGLPAIWVLAAVSIGGRLMGVVGMLIFIPVLSVVYALFREIVYLKLKKAGIDMGRERADE